MAVHSCVSACVYLFIYACVGELALVSEREVGFDKFSDILEQT